MKRQVVARHRRYQAPVSGFRKCQFTEWLSGDEVARGVPGRFENAPPHNRRRSTPDREIKKFEPL